MKLCLSQATICETETPIAIEAASRGGFTMFEAWWPRIHAEIDSLTVEKIASSAAENEVALVSLAGVGFELVGSETLWHESRERAEQVFSTARTIGIPMIVFTPGLTHEVVREEFFGLASKRLSELTAKAEAHGLNLAMEFRSDSRWLTTLATAAALVAQVGDERLGLCLDLFHFWCGPSKLEDLNPAVVGLLRSVQFSDIIGTPREIARDSDRILPGEGDFELGPIMASLRRSNYDGLLCAEVPNPQLWPIPADRVADMAYQSLLRTCVSDDRDS